MFFEKYFIYENLQQNH